MNKTDDIKDDLKDISEDVLGDLPTEERLRLFVQAAADDREDHVKWLADTAPMYTYTGPDTEYTDGARRLVMLSLYAAKQLEHDYYALKRHAITRDRQVAVMLLNETLARLARDGFGVDEYGNMDAAEHAAADYDYGMKQSPDIAFLATKYRRLWNDLPFELVIQEDDRSLEYFPNLAASSLIGYADDLSGAAFDDLPEDRLESDAYLHDLRLLNAVIDFYTHFHGFRLFAEDYLGVSFDEFLGVTTPEEENASFDEGLSLNEDLCRDVLSLHEDYLESAPTVITQVEDADEEISVNLDARAQQFADDLATDAELPL